MTKYSTYQAAKIANPKLEIYVKQVGLYTNQFTTESFGGEHCNPKDYCMTLEKFLAYGYKFVSGDEWLDDYGDVVRVKEFNIIDNNTPCELDYKRYILKAKALEDNANSSKTPSDSEWDGADLPPVGVECVFTPDNTSWGFNYTAPFKGTVLHYEGEQFVFMLSHENFKLEGDMLVASRTDKGEFSKPETESQKLELERCDLLNDTCKEVFGGLPEQLRNEVVVAIEYMLDAGYRKGKEND